MDQFHQGYFINEGTYHYFKPSEIDRRWEMKDTNLANLLAEASNLVGKLDMFSKFVPNIDLFIRLHVVKEATKSSKIEGTNTDLPEAVQSQNQIRDERRDDWREVQNYVEAMNLAIEHLKKLPISSRLIKIAHKSILQGVRGARKEPGEFRRSQNWIGGMGISSASFVPPPHIEIAGLMGDLEKFANSDETNLHPLVKVALIHYQFETIHPFLDGNGRVGRLLITLYLVQQKVLEKPLLYLSDFFERHKLEYYEKLMLVRKSGDLQAWITFFLAGIIETAKTSIGTLEGILNLNRTVSEKINTLRGRAENAQKVVEYLYVKPIVEVSEVTEIIGLSRPASYKLVDSLERIGILKKWGDSKPQKYVFDDYLSLFMTE
ncbi:Fic family protein [Croceimicrobium hydrocarbonivorans]|uniref:Fic family protein n=1 Tax=Croceimicrobium hydrocarbonivorans TaxID=2761580 RepID=A0A7H0VFV3_9FLAO|nr:Fic family protein [Croceimicrobium hydrocarbonivorans]QNR24601.1 Fic family protein [Croceimicrobium hydrocarbonivorans]